MSTVAAAFDTFDYATGGGVYSDGDCTIEGPWEDEPAVNRPITNVPRAHITPAIQNYLQGRAIRFKGVIGTAGGGTFDDLRAIQDPFNYAHRPGFRKLFLSSDRYLMAQVYKKTVTGYPMFGYLDFELEFGASDPFWYANSPVITDWSPSTGTTTEVITNTGGATSKPQVEFIVGGTGAFSLQLTNTSSDLVTDTFTSLTFAYPATAADVVVIDMLAQTIFINGVNAMNYLTAGGFWSLVPGSNTLQLILSSAGGDSFQVTNYPRWL